MMKEESDDHGNDDPAHCPAHPETILGLNYRCEATKEDVGGSAFGVTVTNIDRALVLPGCVTATSTAGASNLTTLFRERKLILILDLDRTLLNSTRLDGFSTGERWFGFTRPTPATRST
jgi:RNA polymerase II C-terminal domain phosphatase-like 3/4